MKVVELFAGVGGFRLAAEKTNKKFDFVWVNQWEPNQKNQFAFDCYERHFGHDDKRHVNDDISVAKYNIPLNFDLLVGGFPCQDYSVATTKAKGIEGIKGVLWWEINWILENRHPKLVLLENVDRLLKSPAQQRGRDFAIMLRCFHDNGYCVKWMMNNGADFGYAQRRKRVFIYAYLSKSKNVNVNIFKDAFDFSPRSTSKSIDIMKYKNLQDITKRYNQEKFLEYGEMDKDGKIITYDYRSNYQGNYQKLSDILEKKVGDEYILNEVQMQKMMFARSSKKIKRKRPNGEVYWYSEGQMALFDDKKKTSRTMLTSEGTINRSSHLIEMKNGQGRFITPLECERLNGFEDKWTEGMTKNQRYFCMGNALNVDLVSQMLGKLNGK